MKRVIVKFNQQTSQAIVITYDDDDESKFELTNQGEWRILKEGQKQEPIQIVRIYDQATEDE